MSNMVINTNVLAINSHRALKGVGNETAKSSERLSSGLRINRAADDAAGLAISEKMRSQIRGLNQASNNSQDGISLIQTAEGALQETQNMLQRMRQLVVQASNDTLTGTDRDKIALELNQLSDEINATAEKTEFNTKKLIDGSWSSESIWLQTGANKEQGLSFNIAAMSATILGVDQIDIGDKVTGGGDLEVISGNIFGAGNALDFNNADDVKAAAGTYQLQGGASFTLSEDGVITINGFGSRDGSYTKDQWITEFGGNAAGNAATTGTLTMNTSTGVLTVAHATTPSWAGDTIATLDGGESATLAIGGSEITVNGNTDTAVDNRTYEFDLASGAKVYDSQGNAVAIDTTKTYDHDELLALTDSDDGILVINGTQINFSAAAATPTNVAVKGDAEPTGKQISSLVETIDKALEAVSTQRAHLGALQNRLEHTIKNLDVSAENLSASESRIRDTDMAKEMMNLTKSNVLSQAAMSMLAQANQAPQSLLQLLR